MLTWLFEDLRWISYRTCCNCIAVPTSKLRCRGALPMGKSDTESICKTIHTKGHFDKQTQAWGSDAETMLNTHILYAFVVYLRDMAALFSKARSWNIGLHHGYYMTLCFVQREGSYSRGPTTGCFSINKDFLLSSEVQTDAFIGAKFTICTRRELPLGCSEFKCSNGWSFSCLTCSWASEKTVSQPQQASCMQSYCTLTSPSRSLYIWAGM